MSGSRQKERVEKFKELVKSGLSVYKALKESGLHPRYYRRHYEEIWSDPGLEPYRPEKFKKRMDEKPPEVEEADRRLAELGVKTEVPEHLKSGLEKELEELELKRQSLLRAAEKALRLYGGVAPGAPSATVEPNKTRDIIAEFEGALSDFESKRARVKEALERMGLKVEDVYMRKDEVERLVEEARRRATEEAMDDKRIEAVADIISDAISKIIEMFKPAVQALFTAPEGAPESGGRKAEHGESK